MASSSSDVKSVLVDPEYVQFLLNPDLDFSCYFVVGNEELAPVEKIGVVRKMLAAHSEVFRSQLLDKKWKSEEPEKINDIFPATFKNLLRFVYGHDTTATMSFDDADDLFYVADRYIMPRLKNKLATRLMTLLDFTNICSLLTNPACARELELQSEINKVIQLQTDKILAHPQFLNCSPETFVKILEQEALNVSEVELWQAALKWAKKSVKNEDSEQLRQQLTEPLQYIRLCSMPPDTFLNEVAHTVFSEEEVKKIAQICTTGEKSTALTAVSNNTNPRTKVVESCSKFYGTWYRMAKEQRADIVGVSRVTIRSPRMSFWLHTLASPVKILTLVCFACREGEYNFTVGIQEKGSAKSIVVCRKQHFESLMSLSIPMSTTERELVLSANSTYMVTFLCDRDYNVFTLDRQVYRKEHFIVDFPDKDTEWNKYCSPIKHISYKVLTPCF